MIVGVPRETFPGEHRVALVPSAISALKKRGIEVMVEAGAGLGAGYSDAAYEEQGVKIAPRKEVYSSADVIFQVRGPGANPDTKEAGLGLMREGQLVIANLEPLMAKEAVEAMAAKRVKAFALELVPRITRAQSMDVLSSQANLAGYKAVLIAADRVPKIFPMMMTAAGTIPPARVFVIGAGVAGLQAIATAKRLGAKVSAYDVRPAVKEQVESLGGKFVELALDTSAAEDKGGYAKEQGEEFLAKQREMMKGVCAESDVVITTAAIPGRRAPVLLTREMVEAMPKGSVVVDLAAPTGGNCELTEVGVDVDHDGVTIIGPVNAPSMVAQNASQMFSKNVITFLLNMVTKEGVLEIDTEDEIVRETLVTSEGEIVCARVREVHGLPPLEPPAEAEAEAETSETEASES